MVDEVVEKNQIAKQAKSTQWVLRITAFIIFLGVFYMVGDFPHHGYTERTRVAEALLLARPAKDAIVGYFNEYHHFPSNNFDAGLAEPSDIKSSGTDCLEINTTGSGKETKVQIILIFNKKVYEGKTLILSAFLPKNKAAIIWDCKGGTLPMKYRPAECR